MTIQLKPEQEKFIEVQVASGKYNFPEEVMDKMFLFFEQLQSEYDEWLIDTRAKGVVYLKSYAILWQLGWFRYNYDIFNYI